MASNEDLSIVKVFDVLENGDRNSSVENSVSEKEGTMKKALEREEVESKRIQNQLDTDILEDRKQDRKERKHYAEKTFGFLCTYMLLVFLLLVFAGCDNIEFHFSDSVVVALITTTTANVIGIFLFVMRYLFNGNAKKSK